MPEVHSFTINQEVSDRGSLKRSCGFGSTALEKYLDDQAVPCLLCAFIHIIYYNTVLYYISVLLSWSHPVSGMH